MPLNADISTALQLLEHIQQTIDCSDDAKLQAQTNDDLNFLISVLENPILRGIVTVQDSLSELNQQLQQHPSILPVDFDITACGDLVLNVPPPVNIYDAGFDGDYRPNNHEFEDQRVPVAKLSHSSPSDTSSPQITSPSLAPEDVALPPITTPTYALEFQKAIEASSQGREVLTVQLFKPEGSSLGFSVVGLRSEEKGELGIFVQEIQPTGIAGRDGNLHEGDQILAIDGQPLDSNISHQQAISILQKARGLVELVVARTGTEETPITPPSPSPIDRSPSAVSDTSKAGSDMVLNTEWAQVEVIDLINDGSGLGFGIIGGRSTGVVVKTILPGGVADRDNRLQSGDHILQIGEVNLRGMGSEQVAAVLRQSGSHVRLVVARPVEPTSPDYQALGSHAPIVPTKILGDPEELDRHLLQNGYTETFNPQLPVLDSYDNPFIYSQQDSDIEGDPSLVVDVVRNTMPIGPIPPLPLLTTAPSLPVLTMDLSALDSQSLPEMEKFVVELKKDYHGIGITIAGYVCEKEELSGIFVKSISEGSAADLCKKIQVNDRIVEVDGQSLQGYTNHQAVEVLRNTGQVVTLCLERYLRGPKFEQLQQAIAKSELKPPTPSSPSATSLPRYPVSTDGEETEIEVEGESHTTVDSLMLEQAVEAMNPNIVLEDVECLIDTDYTGELKPAVEDAIQAKWGSVMGPDVEIVVAQLCKFGEGGGLGISLEGTVDVEDGQEVRPHHYIRSILPDGPVGINHRLRSGDELLEVNGLRLLGMNHIEVVTILKDLPMNVRMVCARRPGEPVPYRVIDTSQDREAFAARSILGGSLQNLIPTTDRLVKAKSDGSLASTTTATATDGSFSKMKSRSLEPLTGLAMWSSEPQIIELIKGERGLGFSILDYQDPMNPNETVIVIRSLVPGGVAQVDGHLIPGDRLLFVNDTNLENASLDQAVQALKGAPKGIVRIGVAKPLPIPDSVSHSQELLEGLSQATATLDDHSMFSSSESLSPTASDLEHDDDAAAAAAVSGDRQELPPVPQSLPPASEDELERSTDDNLSGDLLQLMVPVSTERLLASHQISSGGYQTDEDLDDEDMATGWAVEVLQLPTSLELDIRVHKGPEPLGISVDAVDKGENGMLVVALAGDGVMARDGRVTPGDYLTSVNNESLRRVTNAQARAILRRAQLLSSDISVTYIPGEAAAVYRKSLLDAEPATPPVSKPQTQISPSSPYLRKEESVPEELCVVEESRTDHSAAECACVASATEDSDSERDHVGGVEQTRERLGYEPSADSEATVSDGGAVSSCGCGEDSEASPALEDMTVTRPDKQPPSSVLLAKHWGPERTVEVLREPNCSLGISIVGGKVDLYNAGPDSGSAISGIFIKNVLQQSPAGRAGNLKTGDRILEVDGIDLRQASHERAVEVIRGAGNPVRFLVQSLIQWSVDGDVESETSEVASASSAGAAGGSVRKRRAPVPPSPTAELLRSAPPPTSQARTPTPEIIQEGLGDEIKQEMQQKKRASIHHKPPPPKPPTDAKLQSQRAKHRVSISEKAANIKKPPEQAKEQSSSESEDDDEEEEDIRDLEGRMIIKTGREIDRASAANVKRTPEEVSADAEEEDEFGYTTNKVKKKYGAQGQTVVAVQLERGHQGLGISLAGHKDRSRMAVFVCGLNPAGTAYRSGGLQVGDEILEVNGVVLQGRCHLNASAIIKGLAGPIFKVIVLRRETALGDLAVKPITQFPVSLDDETPEEKYSNFKGLRTVSIKKPSMVEVASSPTQQGTQGLGIMIIEGKHAEVGQGIFISDIQEGSAAEQAGLVVGDMILAVNKDTLLGSDYDSAASLLKKTEGIVTLVVCNPNKAKEEDKKAEPSGAATPAAPDAKDANARSPTPTKAAAPPAIKEPEKPRLLPKPVISSSKSQKPLPPKTLSVTPSSLMPNETPTSKSPMSTPARPLSLATTTDAININASSPCVARLSPTPSGKHCLLSTPEEPVVDPTTCEIVVGKETTIEINKDKMGLGLSIVGGSDTLLSVIIIHEVYPDGAAAKDGRLKPGDQILEVNNEDFRNITHSKALAALRQTPAKVKMVVFRDESTAKDDDIFNIMEVELMKKPGKGLGLSIVGRKNGNGVFISDVVHGGTAEADGRLMKGDQILAVNGQDLKGATQEEAAAVLKTATGRVTIKLGRLKATSRGGSGTSGSDRIGEAGQPRTVMLERGPDGLGFSIVGGHCSPHGDLPIYVKTVFEKGAAARSGQLSRGDQILAVDGTSLEGLTHQQAVAVLKRAQGTITLTIQS